MAIIEFKQKGYKRLKDIKEIHLTPKTKMQLILGTNGSGKSALIREMSPLSSSRKDYEDGGYKQLKVMNKGFIYDCLSDFRESKNHYSISKDGEVLYEGHSSTAYDSHVETEFKLTRDIHAVKIGAKRFSSMSVEAKREWFNMLSPDNYDYAIEYYKKLNTTIRDLRGSIKKFNERLLKEKDKLINAEAEHKIRKEIVTLKEARSSMMQYWRPMEMTVDESLLNVSRIDSTLSELTQDFNKSLKSYCNAKGYSDPSDIWEDISNTQAELTVINNNIQTIHEQLESNQILLNEAAIANGKDESSLKSELADISRSITEIDSLLVNKRWVKDAINSKLQYESVFNEIIPLMSDLADDPDLLFTVVNHKSSLDELNDVQLLINGFENELIKHNSNVHTFEHRAKEDHTSCPKCKHSWIRGYSKFEHDAAISKRDDVFDKLQALKTKSEIFNDIIEKSSYQLKILQHLWVISKANTYLAPLWDEIFQTKLIQQYPKKAIEVVKAAIGQIDLSVSYNELISKRDEITKSIKQLNDASSLNFKELNSNSQKLESKLISLQQEAFIYQQSLAGLKKAQKAMEFQDSFITQTDDLLSKRGQFIQKAEIANRYEAINEIMAHIETEITDKETILNQADSQHRLIQMLEQDVQQFVVKEKMLTRAAKTLSPSEGLIAKGQTGFINHFIAQLNAVIEKVWVYPLTIKPLTISDEEKFTLDYKFPFTVDDKPAGNDISEGSGAQIEIFDMAFMLVSMMNLGLEETEIFLDEFSIKMDHGHRIEAMKMVTDLVTQSDFSQIFMISHYEGSYGALSDVDITVTCPINIKLPTDLPVNVNSKVIY